MVDGFFVNIGVDIYYIIKIYTYLNYDLYICQSVYLYTIFKKYFSFKSELGILVIEPTLT